MGMYNVGCTWHYVITPRGTARRPVNASPREAPDGYAARTLKTK